MIPPCLRLPVDEILEGIEGAYLDDPGIKRNRKWG